MMTSTAVSSQSLVLPSRPIIRDRAWSCCGRRILLGRKPLVMGIVNVTPDSFSDGGKWLDPDQAIAHGLALVREGADVLDIGGESTRPGAEYVEPDEELRRIMPVVKALSECTGVPISVDTRRAEVARKVIEAGACIINDVKPFLGDEEMAAVIRETGAGLVVMHAKGIPKTMDSLTDYEDVVDEVERSLQEAFSYAVEQGIDKDAIMIDPGIGFAKTTQQSLSLLASTDRLARIAPILVGVSRKRVIGDICHEPDAPSRDGGSVGCAAWCYFCGAAVMRVHAVRETRQAFLMIDALERAREMEVH